MNTKPYNIEVDTNAAHYWSVFFGEDEHPHNVIANFDLTPGDRRGFSEWLSEAESMEQSEAYESLCRDLGADIGRVHNLIAEDLQRAAQEVADEEAGDDDAGGVCEHGHSHHGVCPRCRAFALSGA